MQKVSELISTIRNSKYLGLIAILVLVAIIPITVLVAQMSQDIRQRASEVSLSPVSPPSTDYPNVSFDLSPTTITKTTQDAPFQAQITIKAGTNNVTGLDFTLAYDPNVLELADFSPTNSFSTQLLKTIDSRVGTLRYSAVNMQGSLTGNVLVGTLVFRPKTIGVSTITFSTIKLTVLNYTKALVSSNQVLGTYIVVAPAPISVTPTQIPVLGDANGDRVVDILDYNIWRDEYMGTLSTKRADFNNDGVVDLTDFNIWRNAANPATPTTSVASPTPTAVTSTTPSITNITINSNRIVTISGWNFLNFPQFARSSRYVSVRDGKGGVINMGSPQEGADWNRAQVQFQLPSNFTWQTGYMLVFANNQWSNQFEFRLPTAPTISAITIANRVVTISGQGFSNRTSDVQYVSVSSQSGGTWNMGSPRTGANWSDNKITFSLPSNFSWRNGSMRVYTSSQWSNSYPFSF